MKPENDKGKRADCSGPEIPSSFVKCLAFPIGEYLKVAVTIYPASFENVGFNILARWDQVLVLVITEAQSISKTVLSQREMMEHLNREYSLTDKK